MDDKEDSSAGYSGEGEDEKNLEEKRKRSEAELEAASRAADMGRSSRASSSRVAQLHNKLHNKE